LAGACDPHPTLGAAAALTHARVPPQFARNPFPKDGCVVPERYLEAAGETFILMLLVSWALTAAFNPAILADNKLRDRVGYNNLCVGFDSPPARYVAMPLQARTRDGKTTPVRLLIPPCAACRC
jgi:hypothetical protein